MISVVIITYNEERHIKDCLQSLDGLSNDIIVIDAESTDRTVSIAEQFGTRVISKSWTGYGDARNFGAEKANHDWIFSIDADERCTPPLIRSIHQVSFKEGYVYCCKRINRYRGRFMKYGYLSPEWKSRIYHRHTTRWDDQRVHERLKSDLKFRSHKLDGELMHMAYESYEELLDKLLSYADLSKRSNGSKHQWNRRVKQWFSPPYHFLRSYLLHLGFLEGKSGWETSLAAFYYTRQKYRSA